MQGDGGMVGLDVWKRTKSREAGMWGLKPLRGTTSGIKPEKVFSFISTLAHGGTLRAPLTSLAARKKSRFAEKKSASPKKKLRLPQSY